MVFSNSSIVIVKQPYCAEAFSQPNIPRPSTTFSCFISDNINPTKINAFNIERFEANRHIDNLPVVLASIYTHQLRDSL